MNMIEQLLERHKVTLATVVWVVVIIIVPLTVWFAAISYQIDGAHAKIGFVQEKEKKLSEKLDHLDTRISDKLESIHKDVGEIRGELKRLK